LEVKRQLVGDTLLRVTDPGFAISSCRGGLDRELATLQVNFFEQILSAVLQSAEGKGLVTTHSEVGALIIVGYGPNSDWHFKHVF
jgi:hypothetical protein